MTGDHGPGEITAKDGKIKLNFNRAYYSTKQLGTQQFITVGILPCKIFVTAQNGCGLFAILGLKIMNNAFN